MTLRVLLIVVLLAAGDRALACSCAQRTEAEQLESSVAAFDAVVIEVRQVRFKMQESGERAYAVHGERVTFRVTRSLKGPHAAGSIVHTSTMTECCMCGLSARKGQRWHIVVTGKEPYGLSLCSGSHLLDSPHAK